MGNPHVQQDHDRAQAWRRRNESPVEKAISAVICGVSAYVFIGVCVGMAWEHRQGVLDFIADITP